jgi:hypothetical protein
MRALIKIFIINLIFGVPGSYCQNFPLKLSRADDKTNAGHGGMSNTDCEARVKVIDERPSSCGLSFPYLLYPVIIEEFDFKGELPNNWSFNYGYTADDDYETNDNGHIWMGSSEDAYSNNLDVFGGNAHLLLKKEDTPGAVAFTDPLNPANDATPKNYRFTGSALTSRFKTRQGIVKVFAKFPENNLLWLGCWKRGDKQEIDIFEAWDDEPDGSTCETYHQMKMHIHNLSNTHPSLSCVRGRKFNLPSDFYDGIHKFVCDYTNYRVDFALDDKLVGYANKYYEGPYMWAGGCYTDAESGIPNISHGCNTMQNLTGCLVWFPGTLPQPSWWKPWMGTWPYIPPHCITYNKVDKDEAYPNTQNNMDVRVSMAIRDIGNSSTGFKDIENKLFNDWDSFSSIDKEIVVDRIEVWHLIHCTQTLNFQVLNDFLSASGKTGFASGGQINLGNTLGAATFTNELPALLNGWADHPIHLLATDQISFIGGNLIFEEGTYLRAEIINCNGQTYNERLLTDNGKTSDDLVTDETIKEMEQQKLEEYFQEHPEMRDSIAKMYEQQQYAEQLLETYKQQNLTSITDNGAIIVYPNPTKDFINIDMVEEDFNDILYLETVNSLGQSIKYERTKQLDLSAYASGMYQLKFYFSHGFMVVKSITKL